VETLLEEQEIATKATIPNINTFAFMTRPPIIFLVYEKLSTFATKFV
jgi:hypothetical protein